jgi:hypothetical protein
VRLPQDFVQVAAGRRRRQTLEVAPCIQGGDAKKAKSASFGLPLVL